MDTLVGALAITLMSILGSTAQAQTYPQRPITLIVPFAPGGGTDSIARDMAKTLAESLGQPVIVDNRGGGGGVIGANAVAKAAADGHTLLFATSTLVTNAASEPATPYQITTDFSPVAMIGRGPLLVVASKALGVKTVAQLTDVAKTRPQGLNYCSAGNGSINHLAGEVFHQQTKLNLTHVPYKGSGPATLDVLAGRIDLFFATVPTILPHVREQRVELLATTGAQRSALFPNTPTMAESGYKDFNLSTWWGVLAPAKTPKDIVDKLNQAVNDAASRDPVKSRLSNEGADPIKGSPADFAQTLAQEITLWQRVARNAGLVPALK